MNFKFHPPTGGSNITKEGFTLVEIMIVVALIATLMTIASTTFFNLMQGANKTEIIKEVKENGDYAISVLQLKIRNARDVTSTCATTVGTESNSLSIENPDGSTSTFQCIQNGTAYVLQEIIIPSPSPTPQITFITNPSVTIVPDCSSVTIFTCKTGLDGKSKQVSITFSLAQANVSVGQSEKSTQNFSTQVSVRNK